MQPDFEAFEKWQDHQNLSRAKSNFSGLCNIYDERSEENGIELWERTDTDRLYMDFATALDEDDLTTAEGKLDTLMDIMEEVETFDNEFELCINQIGDDIEESLSAPDANEDNEDDDVEADEDTNLEDPIEEKKKMDEKDWQDKLKLDSFLVKLVKAYVELGDRYCTVIENEYNDDNGARDEVQEDRELFATVVDSIMQEMGLTEEEGFCDMTERDIIYGGWFSDYLDNDWRDGIKDDVDNEDDTEWNDDDDDWDDPIE